MSATLFRLIVDASGRTIVDLGEDVDDVTALAMAPAEMETVLRSGRWVVLGFAVWSGPDRAAIDVAIGAAGQLSTARVAVRPFDDFAEFAAWCPGTPETTRSPVWLVLLDGVLIGARSGPTAIDGIVSFVEQAGE
jgi:hypothetical protein